MPEDGDLVTHRATGLVTGVALPLLGFLAWMNEGLFCTAFAVEEGCLGVATGAAATLALLGALILVGALDAYRQGEPYI